MRSQKESSPHEIYLRMSTAAKPNVPLKLYANVIGKLMVERELGAKITDGVRQRTIEAKKAHSERKAILLDQPPIPAPGSKPTKRKVPGSGMVVKKSVTPMDQLRTSSSSIAPSRKVSPLPHNPPSSRANVDVRRRLVHFLAMQQRLADDAIRMVGGANISAPAREDLLRLLEDVSSRCYSFLYTLLMVTFTPKVAEQTAPSKKGDKSPRPWTLKPQTWTEVRPYEWPKLTEAERTSMARQARLAFKALRIPESDPAWDNVRYRNTAPVIGAPSSIPPSVGSSSRSSATTSSVSIPAQTEPKRPLMLKEIKAKTKPNASRMKGEISMKDESAKVSTSRVAAVKKDKPERLSSSSSDSAGTTSALTRRLPGSGYQAKKALQVSDALADGATLKSVDPRPARHSLPASLPSKPTSPLPPSPTAPTRKTAAAPPPKPTKRAEESDRERDQEMQKEREREQRDREKRRELKRREREKEKEKLALERAAPATGSKRKTANLDPANAEDEDSSSKADPIPKRRKIEEGVPLTVTSSLSKPRDLQLPKKPVQEANPSLRQKIKKESSLSPPLRGSVSGQDRLSSSPSQPLKVDRPKVNGTSSKTRRKSPIYTSSEDEGEIRRTEPQTRQRKPSPIPPVIDFEPNGKDFRHRPRASYPLPSDHAALRAIYRSSYANYLGAFSKIVMQKQKIEAILKGESESDVDLMDPDELTKLSLEHKTLKGELEAIQEMYMKGKGSSSSE